MSNNQKILTGLVAGARKVNRNPVKTQFTDQEREIVKGVFTDIFRRRGSRRKNIRRDSLLRLCDLLGKPLNSKNWRALLSPNRANKVKNLPFLVGGDRVKKGQRLGTQVFRIIGRSRSSRGVCGGT